MLALLRSLLNSLMFSGTMFFAAGAPPITGSDGGASGADAGGTGSDSGGEGASGGDGDGAQSTEISPDGASGESGQAAGEGQADPNALIDSGDGRKIPQKYAELFKGDKELREMYFAQGALRKAYPGGVREAVQLKRDLEELGGLEAVEQLKGDLDTYHADAELFEKDQAKWIETSFSENPDASLKAFGHSLDYVSEHHPDNYDHLMAKVIVNDLQSLPVREIYDALAGIKDNPKAAELAKALADYYNGRNQLAKKIPEKTENKQLDTEKQQLTQEKEQVRNEKINLQAVPYMNKAVDSALDAAAKSAGFDIAKLKAEQPNRYGRFLKDVARAIHESVLKDEKWLDRYSEALARNETAKCVRMLNARHDQAIRGTEQAPGVVAPVFHEWFGPPKAVAKTAQKPGTATRGTQQPSGNAPLHVNAMPPKNEIDWRHEKTKIIDQVAMRKDGKLVTWSR